KPHAVCIPLPFQSHINAMLKLAKVLHSKGFHITFVNTEFNHERVLISRGPDSLNGLPDFQFRTIPDGLPPCDINVPQDILALIDSITKNGLVLVRNLITKLNEESLASLVVPPVSCIVSDCIMSCTLEAAEELNIPQVLLWPMSATVLMIYLHHQLILEKDLFPIKGNGDLNMSIDFIHGVKDIRLKDIPSFFWDGNEDLQNILSPEILKAPKASAIILNTFDALETEVLDAMKSLLPAIYTIGPLQLLEEKIQNNELRSFGSNLLKEHTDCLEWLDSKQPNSVVYVNFGSTTVMTRDQLVEFAWGLANSKHTFLWVIRPSLVIGEAAILPPTFTKETANRGMISGWCPQEKVLCHSSTGGFLTHCGWNSTMDTMCGGVPIISWPFFADQQTNCWSACVHWGIGTEIDKNVKRDEVEGLVRDLMEGEKGKDMKRKMLEWKNSAQESTKPGGSSYENLDK
ncbi:Udp-glycosyltransferase 85a4, partial [Thalictrum thalictroides]